MKGMTISKKAKEKKMLSEGIVNITMLIEVA